MSMLRAALVILLAGSACAQGGSGTPPVDSRAVDSPSVVVDAPLVDAPVTDAPPVLVDAAPMTDALGDGLFCTANNQCTVSNECCLTLGGPQGFCAPGTVILGECIPFEL